jgi:HEAT repeat protein
VGQHSGRETARPASLCGEIVPALDDLLADLTSGDEARAEAAVPLLAALGETIIPSLRDLLDSTDADIRWWATRTLASLPSLDLSLLLSSLSDAAPEVRQCAALGLCSHPSEAALPLLVRGLSDADGILADLSARALVAVGKPAVESLLEVLKDAPQSARIHAMQALSEIADPRSIRPMIESMSENSAMIQYWAEAGLERMGVNMVYMKP